MIWRTFLGILAAATTMTACVQTPVIEDEHQALLKSNYPIVSVNGAPIPPSYELNVAAGEISALIVYRTYRYDYHCTFTWTAAAGAVYEVTDHENKFPLTLYRWQKRNSLWAVRHDPVDPAHCEREARS